uniref:Uncharacterized protein n=1 Tax=Oncorhynchus tshawytscha TaxID=74940 RepID=A0A8C8GE06_ONCTS
MFPNPHPSGLFPAVLNLASNGPEMYCKLVEHVPGQQVRNTQCLICNNNSERPFGNYHYYTVPTSPSIKNGMDYHYVTITLDLQVDSIQYMILKAANSPRPGNWYYAITDTKCLTRFNILPRTGPPSYTRDDEVICTSFYSNPWRMEGSRIHTSLINGRPSADDPSPTLLNFTSARYIRLQFQRIRTLNANLMTLALNDPRNVDPIRTNITTLSKTVGGMCSCYDHAKACPLNNQTEVCHCEWEHNTCGERCDPCCPSYKQKPWMAGTFLTHHNCESKTTQAVEIHVCHIRGICQTCADGYYRTTGVCTGTVDPSESRDPCQLSSCDPAGSPECVPDQSPINLTAGSCHCKQGYGGQQCDRCAFGYSGYPNCVRCNCSLDGSLNKDPCQLPCVCKEDVAGENCDHCKLGFHHLLGERLRGCEKCYCSSIASNCSDSHWTYSNETSMAGWSLTEADGEGKVWPTPSRDRDWPQILSNNNQEARRHLPAMCSSGHRRVNSSVFKGVCEPCDCHGHGCTDHTTGFHCDECIPGFHGVANKRMPNDCQPCACPLNIKSNNPTCHVDPRGELICDRWQPGYTGAHCDRCTNGYFGQPVVKGGLSQPCQCNGNLDLASPRSCDPITGSCLRCRGSTGESPATPANMSIRILLKLTVMINLKKEACGCNQVGSMTQQCNPNTGCCLCREQSHGKKCSECRLGYRDFPQCISCICNMAGSDIQTCDADQDVCACVDRTGQCSCKANIQGLKCDKCKLGTFGLSTRNPLGCSQCYCFGMTSNCSEAQGLIRLSLKPEQTKLPLVDKDNQQETTRGVTFQHPEIIANADLVTQKLTKTYYWKLPEQFQITAYGGKLKYAIYFEERDETGRTSYEPKVIIKGVSNRNKVMVRHMQGLQIGQPTRHEINMTEVRTWKYKDKNVMTMEDFMGVLFYVDYVLIQSSHGNMMRHSR